MSEKKTNHENPLKAENKALTEKVSELEQKLEEAQTKLGQALSLAREYRADMERMRERSKEIETQKTIEVATKSVLAILPVLDNFELAIQKVQDEQTSKGFKLIHSQLLKVIEDMGAQKIENGAEFNPELHEAISTIPPQTEDQKGKIAHIVQSGYTLFGKVIRASKVVVYGGG